MKARLAGRMHWTWFLIPLMAAAVFLMRIDREHLWLDEAYSAAMTDHGWGEIIRIAEQDVHPPLYYLALKASGMLFGRGAGGLRMLSALFAIGLVLLAAGPVQRIFGPRAAVFYSVIAVLSPGVLCFAQEARMYTMAAFFVLSTALYGIEAIRNQKTTDFIRFGVSMIAAMYTHYFALAAAAVAGVLLTGYAAARERNKLKPLLITGAAAALLYLPWVPSFLVQIHRVKAGFWIPETNWFLIKFSLMAPFAYKYEDIMYPWASVVAMVLSAAAVGLALWTHRHKKETLLPLSFLLGVYLLTPAVGFILSKTVVPILMPRYIICCIGPFLVCVAVGVAAVSSSRLRYGATALLLGLFLPADYNIEVETFHGPFHEVEYVIAADNASDRLIVHEDVQTLFPMQWGLPGATHTFVAKDLSVQRLAGGVYPETNLAVVDRLEDIWEQGKPFWLVDFSLSESIVTERLRPPPGWRKLSEKRFAPPLSFTKIALTRWAPPTE